MNDQSYTPDGAVTRVSDCCLTVMPGAWAFAEANASAIDAHWARRSAENVTIFNGVIHVMGQARIDGGVFCGLFLRTNFKSYLYWRDLGFPAAGVRDCFGSALIRSREGHIVLGRQRAGNVNAGLAYLPGGFIDNRDVLADGQIDIKASILREVGEETGFNCDHFEIRPGFIVTFAGPLVSIAREIVSPLTAVEFKAALLDHIAADPQSELTDAVIVRSPADLDGTAGAMHPYARQLLTWLFAHGH